MARYHVNPANGEVGKCTADIACPFGGDQVHGATREDARMLYEQYVANDTDPHTNQFSEHKKKDRLEARLADIEKRQTMLNKLGNLLDEQPEKIAVVAGLITATVLSAGLAHHTATQDYEPVNTEVVSTKLDVDYVPVKVGKVTTIQKQTSTDYVLKTESGQTIRVSESGEHHPEAGANKVVFQTGADDYTTMEPGSAMAYVVAGGIGSIGGGVAALGALFGTVPASEAVYNKFRKNEVKLAEVKAALRA